MLHSIIPILAGLCTGTIMALSQLGGLPGLLVWVAWIPIFYCLRSLPPTAWILAGLSVSIVWWLPQLPTFWLADIVLAIACPIVSCMLTCMLIVMAGYLARRLPNCAWALCLSTSWMAFSYICEETYLPFVRISASLANYPVIAKLASVIGVVGLDGLVLLVNGSLALLIISRRLESLYLSISICLGIYSLYGIQCSSKSLIRTVGVTKVLGIQPKIHFSEYREQIVSLNVRRSVQARVDDLAHKAAQRAKTEGGAIIVWPEGGVGIPEFQIPQRAQRLARLSKEFKESSFLISAPVRFGSNQRLAMALWEKNRRKYMTYKQHMVPLAEHDISPGTGYIIKTQHANVGVLICYDILFGKTVRSLAEQAELLIVSSDHSAFGLSTISHQHGLIAKLRALEVGRAIAFVTNMGPSFLFTPDGNTVSLRHEEELLEGEVPVVVGQTIAMLGGRHLFVWLMLLLTLCAITKSKKIKREPHIYQKSIKISSAVLGFLLTIGWSVLLEISLVSISFDKTPQAYIIDMKSRIWPKHIHDQISRYYKQQGRYQCGVAATAFALTQFGDIIHPNDLLEGCLPPDRMVSFEEIQSCVVSVGYKAEGWASNWKHLKKLGKRVAIAHLSKQHFVVIVEAYEQDVLIFDPAVGRTFTVSRSDFMKVWSRKILLIEPRMIGA